MDDNDVSQYRSEGSLTFDGVTDYLVNNNFFFPSSNWGIDNSQKFTFSCWIKPNNITTHQNIFCKWKWINAINALGYFLDLAYPGFGSGSLYFSMQHDYINRISAKTGAVITAGKWHHIVVTHNGVNTQAGGAPKIYVNGVLVSSVANTTPATHGSITHTEPFIFGAREYSSSAPSKFYNGLATELALWILVEMSAYQVLELYNGGTPPDLQRLSSYEQVFFGPHLNKWIPLGDNNDIQISIFEFIGYIYHRTRVGWNGVCNFWTSLISNYFLFESGSPTPSKDYPGAGDT